jgi:hypothetical protein
MPLAHVGLLLMLLSAIGVSPAAPIFPQVLQQVILPFAEAAISPPPSYGQVPMPRPRPPLRAARGHPFIAAKVKR